MQHFHFSEQRLLARAGDAPRVSAESGENIDVYTQQLRELTSELRRVYGAPAMTEFGRREARNALLDAERELDDVRADLFEGLRPVVPGLGTYIRLGGAYAPDEGGIRWDAESGRLSFDASEYPDYVGGDAGRGRSYSLEDPGTDRVFSALMGTPGEVNLLSLYGPHAGEPLPYTEGEEPFYVAPSGLYPSPVSMLRPDYTTDYRRVRTGTSGDLDALRRRMPGARPYGTPGQDGFPPAPPEDEEATTTTPARRTGRPGRDGFPAAPPAEERAPARPPRVRPTPPARTEAVPSTARLEREMADTRREYDAARREASEIRALPPSADRTARLNRLAERMENMVTRIGTLEQEIKKLRREIS